MKYSSTLLKKFISLNDSPEGIAQNLTLKTCEIEEISKRILPDELVIGKISSFAKHPQADKLYVCQVDCGLKGKYEIVCGGENVPQAQYVPVALPGCYLPALDVKIEPRPLKGIVSNGMICSKQELGINEDVELHTIRNLGEDFDDICDTDLGISMKQKYPRLEGYVLEVDNKTLTNRPDLTGHRGVACELNAIYAEYKTNFSKYDEVTISFNKLVDWYQQFTHTNIIETLDNSTKLERKVLSKTDGLHTYILLAINNISVCSSSFFTRLQMLDLGLNPKNNRVDFSNLFMLLTGQPIHFFDADKVEGDIIIRNAKEGEEFVDLFDTVHLLKETDIVIADKKKILALAGIVGGKESGISESTKNILVEIANFDSVAVRKTGTRLGLRTDAELRFEKNINPIFSLYCLLFFLEELKFYQKDLGDYQVGGLDYFVSKEVLKNIKTPKRIMINYQKMSEFIFGKSIEKLPEHHQSFEILAKVYLEGLGFILEKKGSWLVPFRRSPDDINIVEDLYEEVARIYGYEKIDPIPIFSGVEHVPYSLYVDFTRKLEEILVHRFACSQMETYPWVSEKVLRMFGENFDHHYILQNPVNPEMPYLRSDMLYGLLSHTAKNSKFFDEFRIFDIGKVWNKKEKKEGESNKYASSFVCEQTHLGVMIYTKTISSWDQDPLLLAKNMIKIMLKYLGIDDEVVFQKTHNVNFHPKKQANILIGDVFVGFVGSLHPLILQEYKISESAGVVYITLHVDQLMSLKNFLKEKSYIYETLQDQIVYRDLCFVLDIDKDFGPLLDAIKKIEKIKEIEVFDVYAGPNLGIGKKSLSLKMKILGEPGKTMTTEEINALMHQAIKAGESVGATLRN